LEEVVMSKSSAISGSLAAVIIASAVGSTPALEALAKDFAVNVTSLDDAVQQGAQIFAADSFGSKRMFNGQPATCASCHSNGGKTEGLMPDGTRLPSLAGAAAAFPKFSPKRHEVITLEEQVMDCISGGLKGEPPSYNDPQIVDLLAYLTSLSKGSVIGRQF
jgi:thiosulfate dehydrogenase